MMNGVSVRNMYSADFRINTYEKVHPAGLFIQLMTMHGLYNIKKLSSKIQRGLNQIQNISGIE